MPVLLNIMNSDYEWSISSQGYREGEPVQIVIENEPVRDWYFIPVTKKDVAREDILAALMSDQQFTNTSKVSFVTQNEIIYDRICTMQFPLLSLYVSAIRINGKNIEESELKTNQMMNRTHAVNQSKQVFSIH